MWIALFFSIAQVCGGLCNSEALTHYARLLDRAQLGHAHSEKAAFLVLETDGRLREVSWMDGESHKASFRGRIPEHCIGIMHTHPIGDNRPSTADRLEAQRLGLPILVVTPEAVTVAWPNGLMSYLANGVGWNATPRRARR